MSAPRTIASRRNPLVQRFRQARSGGPSLLLDGPHLVEEAIAAGLDVEVVVVETGRDQSELLRRLPPERIVRAPAAVLDAVSPARSPAGIVALAARPPSPPPGELLRRRDALVVGAVDVQDPGNTGAIARVAEAAGATALLTTTSGADPFGWKARRGAMGSAFRLPIARLASADEIVRVVRDAGLQVVAAVGRGGREPEEVDLRVPTALLFGAEGQGLPAGVVEAADVHVTIPMARPVESLNVAVTAALLLYEARRQRRTGSAGTGLAATP